MKTRILLAAALLTGLALARPVAAQVPRRTAAPAATPAVPETGSVSGAGRSISTLPAPSVPGHPGGYTDKHLDPDASNLFPNGVPVRDYDAGNSRAARPRSGQAMPGAQPTQSIFKGRKRRNS